MKMKNNCFTIGRREGILFAVDFFCKKYKLEFVKPMLRYNLFEWFFKWYCKSKIGFFLNRNN
jgi:hypothetical protein